MTAVVLKLPAVEYFCFTLETARIVLAQTMNLYIFGHARFSLVPQAYLKKFGLETRLCLLMLPSSLPLKAHSHNILNFS